MRRWLFFVFMLLLVTGCGERPLPPIPPAQIMQQAADAMNGMSGFHFVIERDGASAFVDPPVNTISFRRAEGDYVAPDRAQAVVRVIAPGLVTDVSVISVAEVQWQTNVLTGQWEELPPNWGFNPAVLFDETIGLQAVLVDDMMQAALGEVETLADGPNGRFYHIIGQVAAENLFEMSGGLIGPASVEVQVWVQPETFEIVRTLVTEPATEDAEATVWQVDFSEYGQDVLIEPPVESQ
ncbi:MAG: LppX_LprAFG lipoprotein [Chloroflexi bacterium]|nr:LppX_LprAFG lipoprotein [Chloroflexota bacterium]